MGGGARRVPGGDPAGGSLYLAGLIDEHGAALLFDFRHYLGLDLWDVLFDDEGAWSARAVLALIDGLPEDSAFSADVRTKTPPSDGAAAVAIPWRGWSSLHAMVADLIDAVQANTLATGNWDPKKKRPKFEPYPRPKLASRKFSVADFRKRYGGAQPY